MLVLNKADLLSDREHRQHKFEQWVDTFEHIAYSEEAVDEGGLESLPVPRVHVTSAKLGRGVPELRDALTKLALPRPWDFSATVKTDRSDMERVSEIVREHIFKNLHQAVPFEIVQDTRSWNQLPNGDLVIHQDLLVPTRGVVAMLTGRGGSTVKAITRAAIRDLQLAFRRKVHLYLHISLKSREQIRRRQAR